MNGQVFRLDAGGRIERDKPLAFTFDGRRYSGFAGDTLASALLANGRHLLGRSFKYHRPRGCLTASSGEPNALVELRNGARREPNSRATMIELYEGLEAASQNRFPSLDFDLLALNQCFSRFLGAGFYYKTFMWPSSFWEPVYEKAIRRAAGLGRASRQPDPDRYEHGHVHCDILVVGGGPAGLAAALAAGRCGARVLLMEEMPWLGGDLSQEQDVIDDLAGRDWIAQAQRQLASMPDVCIKTRCAVFGQYDHNVFAAVERVGDHLAQPPPHRPRQRLWSIRARRVILATGAHERPLVFDDNDRPGIMLASAMRHYVERFAVAPGRRIAIATNNDAAYHSAFALLRAGIEVAVIADARLAPGACANQARDLGLRVHQGMLPMRAHGARRVRGLSLQRPDGAFAERVDCDAIAVSGGHSPDVALASHKGAALRWREDILGFVPPHRDGREGRNVACIGACHGVYALDACLQDGHDMGLQIAGEIGFAAERQFHAPRAQEQDAPAPPYSITPVWHCPGKGKAFVDFQNDVTTDDIHLAHREGYRSVEHLKRYTTLGMATDQGRSSNVNGLAILAMARGEAIEAVGITRHRPPAVPVAIGAFAGHERGKTFQPVRRSAMHACHEQLGALFVEAGQWLRPRCYPKPAETMEQAIWREACQVRRGVGMCDVSTLGKIDVFGKDAAEFLNRLYINGWSKLAIGKARYGIMLREDGVVFDDGTTSRLGAEHFFMTTTTANAAAVLAHMEKYAQTIWPQLDVNFCSATEQWCGVAVAGPSAREVLARLFGPASSSARAFGGSGEQRSPSINALDVSNEALPFMGAREFSWLGSTARIFRISFSGELAYEINVPWGYGETLWQRLLEAGGNHDIIPYGTEALSVLRIEKGHVAGNELDGRTTATDMGLAGMMSGKKHFIGRNLCQREGMSDDSRPALVGVKPVDRAQRLRAGAHFVEDPAREGRIESLGWISSVADSPALGCWIGLGYLRGGKKHQGERRFAWYPLKEEMVEVEICHPVFFDPQGERLHG